MDDKNSPLSNLSDLGFTDSSNEHDYNIYDDISQTLTESSYSGNEFDLNLRRQHGALNSLFTDERILSLRENESMNQLQLPK